LRECRILSKINQQLLEYGSQPAGAAGLLFLRPAAALLLFIPSTNSLMERAEQLPVSRFSPKDGAGPGNPTAECAAIKKWVSRECPLDGRRGLLFVAAGGRLLWFSA